MTTARQHEIVAWLDGQLKDDGDLRCFEEIWRDARKIYPKLSMKEFAACFKRTQFAKWLKTQPLEYVKARYPDMF